MDITNYLHVPASSPMLHVSCATFRKLQVLPGGTLGKLLRQQEVSVDTDVGRTSDYMTPNQKVEPEDRVTMST
jgi:hypothetical protein